jgi:hypothetical protein
MQLFDQKTQTDLPNLRKRQTYRDKEKEADAFDLLFKNNNEIDLIDLRKNKRFKGYHFYLAIGVTLLIAACFLVVQVVTNSPEIEKYKTVTNNIEDVENDNEEPIITKNESPADMSIPDVRFADPSVNQPQKSTSVAQESKPVTVIKKTNLVLTKKVQINRTPKIKTIIKTNHIIAHKVTRASVPKKTLPRIESKVDRAIAEIMLRPLAVVSKQSSEAALREPH